MSGGGSPARKGKETMKTIPAGRDPVIDDGDFLTWGGGRERKPTAEELRAIDAELDRFMADRAAADAQVSQ
jgi:hypothetical protein